MEEAHVEPGALMICSVIVRWLEEGRREEGKEVPWSRVINRLLLPPTSSF